MRQHDTDRHVAAAHEPFGRRPIEVGTGRVLTGRGPDPEPTLLLEPFDEPAAEIGAVLVDNRDANPRRLWIVLLPEYGGENRKEDDRQQEGQRLRHAVARQVRPRDANQREHRQVSAPGDRTAPLLSQLPSGQMDEHGLQARPAHVEILDRPAGVAKPLEQRRQFDADILEPRPHDARVDRVDIEPVMAVHVESAHRGVA